ncbi:SDR family oxidoreductase [Agrobacterium sp. ST15.16.024]|uniref:SDR family oxidoreductase n=1 Tax=Agrobacterium sp. ST15.16.024 TaxID=3020524 RepID=UPI002300AFEC|nr:SDR family oxidoreductase [Agrobacterium sp. ST15.16.024]MDA5636465.1 SDR family oxidoreductase [Agrobacterium sp. ST15.16.024]
MVTGGARNIGQAIVLRLIRDGASVMLNYGPGTEADASETVAKAEALGGHIFSQGGDLSEPEVMPALLSAAIERFGRADILVNNAAITGPRGPISGLSLADFERIFAINTRSVFLGMKAASQLLADGGRIISIASSTTIYPKPDLGVYAASKAAVKALTEAFAGEAGRRGITVNTVMPGPTVPGIFQDAPASRQEELRQASPFGRLGEPADIADVVAFLASDDARWVTGQHLLVNGGSQH